MVGSGESGEEMESSLLLWSLRSRGGYRFKGFQKFTLVNAITGVLGAMETQEKSNGVQRK